MINLSLGISEEIYEQALKLLNGEKVQKDNILTIFEKLYYAFKKIAELRKLRDLFNDEYSLKHVIIPTLLYLAKVIVEKRDIREVNSMLTKFLNNEHVAYFVWSCFVASTEKESILTLLELVVLIAQLLS